MSQHRLKKVLYSTAAGASLLILAACGADATPAASSAPAAASSTQAAAAPSAAAASQTPASGAASGSEPAASSVAPSAGASDPATADASASASEAVSSAASSPAPAESTASAAAAAGAFVAGTYSADGSYQTPAGEQTVGVSLTIDAAGVVSAVTVTPHAAEGNSVQFQGLFASGISSEVVGKNIDELQVSHVSGSSLTSGGFNAALEQIKSEAKA